MTKGKNEQRHIQNRTWEKDRRDRLNNTFDKLAKLLPEYRPKVTFSKIEILHKTILYIEDLRKNLRDVLSTENASMLKTQEELEESLKALVLQNNNLVELLEKANVKVPHFVGPKLLSFIVTVHDAKANDENEKIENESITSNSITTHQTPQPKSDGKNVDGTQKLSQPIPDAVCKKSDNSLEKAEEKSPSKSQLTILPELKDVQSFGSVDVIPVTSSSKPELKVHEKPVKNFVEITPLLSGQNEKTSTSPDKSCDLVQSKEAKNDKRSLDVSMILNKIQPSDSPVASEEPKQSNTETNSVEKTKSKFEAAAPSEATPNCDMKPTKVKECKISERNSIPSNVPAPNQATNKQEKVSERIDTVCPEKSRNKVTIESVKVISNGVITASESHSGKKVDSQYLSKVLNENLSNEKDLSDELFGNFPMDQTVNESNPNTLSPTAAFLLSFPVVSTVSSSKPIEADNSYSEGGSLLRLEEKPNQPKDHCLFESISSILNDLNDVSDAKNISNVDHSGGPQFAYCANKNRSSNDHEKSNVLHDINTIRSKSNQKNLNINSLLNDDKVKCNRLDSMKTLNTGKKPPHIECSTNTMQVSTLLGEKSNYAPSKTFENVSNPTENPSDFYVSLSTLGLPLKSAATLSSTPINPSVGTHFNFQISSLTQPRNLIDSRPLIADTPFTFSLTKCSNTTSTTNSTTKTVSQQPESQCQMSLPRPNKPQKKSSPTKHLVNDRFVVPPEPTISSLNRCNTFNPLFSFDNPPILSSSSSMALGNLTSVSSTSSSIGTPFTFTLTPSFSTISNSTPLLSNHDPLFSSSFDMPIMRSTTTLAKNQKRDKVSASYCNEKEHSPNWKNAKNCSVPVTSKPSKNLVNWMTSSVNKPTQELQLDFISQLPHCSGTEEVPAAWSPNRISMDNTSLISSSALPMLQGDLALNTISNSCNLSTNKFDMETKRATIKSNTNQKYSSKLPNNRKPEHHVQHDRSTKGGKSDKKHLTEMQSFKSHHSTTVPPIRMNDQIPITNNFHSVSQLLDQERQTANKNTCYMPNDGKMAFQKESNSVNSVSKSKFYPKYESDGSNQVIDSKFSVNSCNASADLTSNECDRDLFGGYFFGQSKRLKLNYHPSSEFLGNQSFTSTYENLTANDMLPSYANYQTFDSDCNNVSVSSGINNLTNQTYSYQYTQPQSYNHQPQQQPLSTCDPIDSSNYFQAPVSLPNYKPPNFNEVVRSNSKTSTHQSFLHQTPKSVDPIPNPKLFPSTASASTSNISTQLPTQLPMCSINRNTSVCPSKSIQYPSHTNINNLPLNQAWNDSFSWMPYTNSIDKPYNNNLFQSTDSSTSKAITTTNITGNNNTIPNFNLTTIFPDYNKS